MTMRDAAEQAVEYADAHGRKDREQAALSWLHRAGYFSSLTCDEARWLEDEVREACLRTGPVRCA